MRRKVFELVHRGTAIIQEPSDLFIKACHVWNIGSIHAWRWRV